MSDDDFFAESDDEDYGFDYESGDDEFDDDDPEIVLQNTFYESKGLMDEDPKQALEGFQNVLDMEQEKGDWGFKALKQMVKLQFQLGMFEETMANYRKLLTYTKSAVTRNKSESTINNILERISAKSAEQMKLLQNFYETTLEALKEAKNERLWFKTNLKLGRLYFERAEYGPVLRILRELHLSCQNKDGSDDMKKGTQLLEVYALRIQVLEATKDTKTMKEVYEKSLAVKSAIAHPHIIGVIRECGARMQMREKQWEDAYATFFEAFKNYDEAGSSRRLVCLKCLVLASMLMGSKINPFDTAEAKPYQNNPEIVAMVNLIDTYQHNEINRFEKILHENKTQIMDDPFMADYIQDLLRSIRTQVLLRMIQPYTRVHIPFISKELNIPSEEVEALLVSLILDKKIGGYIDQVKQLLILNKGAASSVKYDALSNWASNLGPLYRSVVERLES